MFQTMNSVSLNNLSLNYQRFTPSGCDDVGMGKFGTIHSDECFVDFLMESKEENL